MKSWKILRDCRLKGDAVHHAMLGIARLRIETCPHPGRVAGVFDHADDEVSRVRGRGRKEPGRSSLRCS
ncbi:hypothetical protein GCM10010344_50230 [Streptomyces bluensis]|nr:hypothetical protein GCM10010344_50230 [Streptomyces bluensis]